MNQGKKCKMPSADEGAETPILWEFNQDVEIWVQINDWFCLKQFVYITSLRMG